jgi:zeaxanthin glucosyltransferase
LVQEANLPNILLKSFVPQTELLFSDKVIAFISHGGANSIIESIYYGKFLICLPTTEDQPGMSYRVEYYKAGISL